jgi:23S rRNA (guanosine2251-2'-O)-methyltransferase
MNTGGALQRRKNRSLRSEPVRPIQNKQPLSKRESPSLPDALYGINAVREAVGVRPMEYVLVAEGQHGQRVQEIINACRAAGVPLRFAPRAALDRAAGTTQHQNVVAVCSAKAYDDLESLLPASTGGVLKGPPSPSIGAPPLLVVLDGVEDPANLGAVVRTAVAAGSSGVVIPERRAAGLSPAVARAAAGALEHLRVARVTNLVRTLVDLKERNIWVYGFEAQAEISYLDLDYSAACALVLGGEGRGLHRLVREACDQLACIPLHGPVQSLNISVAAGIVLYEAARQRHSK